MPSGLRRSEPRSDNDRMSTERRALIALTLMSVGLVALLVTGVGSGWTALNVIGIACLAVAIAAQVVVLRRVGAAGRGG